MVAVDSITGVILAIILGTLFAIVYSLRILLLVERRIASVEMNIQKMTSKILSEEKGIRRVVGSRSK